MRKVISEVQIITVKPNNGLVAFASFVLNEELYLGSIGIFTRLNKPGFRLTYPTRKVGNTNIQVFHPITKELSEEINKSVLEKAEEILGSLKQV